MAARFRLKDLGNVRTQSGGVATWDGDALERGLPIVQWLPAAAARPFTVLKPAFEVDEEAAAQGDDESGGDEAERKDAREIEVPPLLRIAGLVEAAALREPGKVVQFERFGFVRIESATQGVWLHA